MDSIRKGLHKRICLVEKKAIPRPMRIDLESNPFWDTYWLMAYDGNGWQHVRELEPGEAEAMEPGVMERMESSRPPVIVKMRELGKLYEKRLSAEANKITLTEEEREELERQIQAVEKEYMSLAFPDKQ